MECVPLWAVLFTQVTVPPFIKLVYYRVVSEKGALELRAV
jgi:hypothetical protein